MTKAAAIHQFWASFGLKAFEENFVKDMDENGQLVDPEFPYITYSLVTDSFGGEVPLSAFLWYRSSLWKPINAKTEEISTAIGKGGKILPCDGGAIWLKRGQPFAQNMGDDNDNMIRRKYINVSAEFITNN